jgi:hypothetical protein
VDAEIVERPADGEVLSVTPAQKRREYSILRDSDEWRPEDGYTGFSELVHQVQESGSSGSFEVPFKGQLTDRQMRVLLYGATTTGQVEALEQEIFRRDKQRVPDRQRFDVKPGDEEQGLLSRTGVDDGLLKEIQRRHEELRDTERREAELAKRAQSVRELGAAESAAVVEG